MIKERLRNLENDRLLVPDGYVWSTGGLFEARIERIAPDTSWQWEYYIKDHLGNIRLTFSDINNDGAITVSLGGDNELLEEHHYYPFGMKHDGPWLYLLNPYFSNGFNYSCKDEMPHTRCLYYGASLYAAAQFAISDSIDGESVADAVATGGITASVSGAIGKKLSEAVSSGASSCASGALRSGLSGNASKAAQRDTFKALGVGVTNAQKATARRTARATIKADARAAYSAAQQNIQRNADISQGVGAAGASKSISEGNKSIISRLRDWWNGD